MHLRPAVLRHSLSPLLNNLLVYIGDKNFRLTTPLARSLFQDLSPRADDNAVTVACPLLVVRANLASSDNVAQRLNSTSLKQRHPVQAAGVWVESGRVEEHGGAIALVVKCKLAEAQVKADCRTDLADAGVEGLDDLFAELDAVALHHFGAIFLVHVEEVDFLVALGDLASLVDPEKGVLDFLRVGIVARLVDTDRDGERVLLGQFLKTENEGRLVDGRAELERLLRTLADVVCGLWQEDDLELL